MNARFDLYESQGAELGRRKVELGRLLHINRHGNLLATPQENTMRIAHVFGSQFHGEIFLLSELTTASWCRS